ncbi:hypothetical protein MBUL_00712 [Methylobacterium bullatum]|uniref:Uncharacterized protein n=1 Tax=Methylobacterium bullatum TaxID=570505 RepID=A0A679IW51_9HYPH|nr:hypothetical protein MBUL_00712 [Methylobacterium bullatum]
MTDDTPRARLGADWPPPVHAFVRWSDRRYTAPPVERVRRGP